MRTNTTEKPRDGNPWALRVSSCNASGSASAACRASTSQQQQRNSAGCGNGVEGRDEVFQFDFTSEERTGTPLAGERAGDARSVLHDNLRQQHAITGRAAGDNLRLRIAETHAPRVLIGPVIAQRRGLVEHAVNVHLERPPLRLVVAGVEVKTDRGVRIERGVGRRRIGQQRCIRREHTCTGLVVHRALHIEVQRRAADEDADVQQEIVGVVEVGINAPDCLGIGATLRERVPCLLNVRLVGAEVIAAGEQAGRVLDAQSDKVRRRRARQQRAGTEAREGVCDLQLSALQ